MHIVQFLPNKENSHEKIITPVRFDVNGSFRVMRSGGRAAV